MFLNPEIKNKLIQQKKYMEEIDFNPFVPNVLYDNLMEIDIKKKSKEYKEELKEISLRDKSKKNKVDDVDKVDDKLDVDKVDDNVDKVDDNVDKVDDKVNDKVDVVKDVPEVPLEKPGVEIDVLDTAELSSDEKNNVKNIIVDASFF